MNIFVLDTDPTQCAQLHCDKHVVKMILESAQMLSTVAGSGYKPTHRNHPCTIWAGESISNWQWLVHLAGELNREWRYRYHHFRNHKSWDVIKKLPTPDLPDIGLTPFAQAMPEQYRQADAVLAYRDYYRNEKSSIATYTKRNKPEWMEV